MIDYGKIIRGRRKGLGLSLRRVSEATGVASSHLSNMENGKHPVNAKNLLLLGYAVGMTWGEIRQLWLASEEERIISTRNELEKSGDIAATVSD